MTSINTELGERALSKMQHEMDWKPLKERCLRVYPTWSGRHVDRILREYQRFLALKVATRDIYDTIVLAPVLLDAMWKQHILSTQQYYADCQLLLQANQILHYNSDSEINVSDSVREKRMELTKASMCMMFSGMYPLSSDAKGIWNYDYAASSGNNVTTSGGAMDSALLSIRGGESNSVVQLVSEEDDDGLPLIGRDDEEEEETQPEVIDMASPKRPKSPKKDRQRHNAKAPHHHTDLQDNESERLLLYVYSAGKVSKLHTYPHETIMAIKAKIQRRMGIAAHQQYLEWEGQELHEEESIGHYGIPSDATLVLTKIRTIGHQQQIDTDILKRQDLLLDSHNQYDHDDDDDDQEDDRLRREERDDPEMRPKRHNINSPTHNRRRSRPSSPPKSPRPPKPPRLPQAPYSPSNNAEDDSYLTDPSTVVHDSRRRRQQALLNKLKIQSHDKIRNHGVVGDLSTHQSSSIPSRPKPKSSPSPPLKVFVNTIMGFTITLTAKASDTVDHLKQMIQEQEDIPSSKQILILDGVPLDDSQLLSEYTTCDSSLHVLLRLQAGSSSAGSLGASSMSPNSTMATVPRKKNHTAMLLTRATGGNAGVTSKWR